MPADPQWGPVVVVVLASIVFIVNGALAAVSLVQKLRGAGSGADSRPARRDWHQHRAAVEARLDDHDRRIADVEARCSTRHQD